MADKKERKQLIERGSKSSMMEGTYSAKMESKILKEPLPRGQIQKKRKLAQKVVVTVKVEGSDKRQKNEGPPSDCWSWRKYGQKPIKGSPYPRGYYRCSTSKGCSAKKQVERCRTDPSVLIITYTSNHNHAGPDLLENKNDQIKEASSLPAEDQHHPTTASKQDEATEREQKKQEGKEDDHFHYCQSPLHGSKEDSPFCEDMETVYNSPLSFLVNEKCISYPHLMTFSAPKSEENDFYDELEELPSSSFFSSFMKRSFFEERILVSPS